MTPSQYRLNQKKPHLLILIIMSSFASMGAVIFTPSLPQIAHYFNISNSYSQLTITLFLVGYALGQLIYGPISNRLGRKPSFYVGIAVASIGSCVSILSEPLNSFYLLIIGRMLEALGSSAGLVIAYTIINDFYYPSEARRVISFMALAFAIAPGVATFIGSIIISHFQWIGCFYFMLAYGFALIIPVSFLKETALTLDYNALHVHDMRVNYQKVSHNRLMIYAAIIWGLSTMGLYLYVASAPVIAIRIFNVAEGEYGFVGFIPFVGTAIGALTSAYFGAKYSPQALAKVGFLIICIAAVLLPFFAYATQFNLSMLLLTGTIYMAGACLISTNLASIACNAVEDKANGASVMNFINISMAVCGTFVLALMPGNQMLKFPMIFACTALIMLMVYWVYKTKPPIETV